MPVQYRRYLDSIIHFVSQQKIFVTVIGVILVMLAGVIIISAREEIAGQAEINNYNSSDNTASLNPSSTNQVNNEEIALDNPPSSGESLTTKFIYFIRGAFGQSNDSRPPVGRAASGRINQSSNTQSQSSSVEQISNSASSTQNVNSGTGGSAPQTGNQNVDQSLTGPTPTPATDINIVFVNENGEYWTYEPPAVPPIETSWVRYTNHQDNYSIEYPANWLVVKSDYNGHEGITLYMPGDLQNIDKPSIAFVGWKANYLSSTAKYSGEIILKGYPGTIYTNGPLGPSSVAAVFEYSGGFFALGSSTSNPVFIYVFDHMLRSLEFNVE